MSSIIAILEDDAARIAEMKRALAAMPSVETVHFESAPLMIAWLAEHLADVALISLDHDLPLRVVDGQTVDCGTGREVVDFLCALPATCPVIVHTSNQHYAPGMMFALADAGWPCVQVYPAEEHVWINTAWREAVVAATSEGNPNSRMKPEG